MNGEWLFVVCGIIGIAYIVYVLTTRDKISIYTRYNIEKYNIIHIEDFLKAQMGIGIFNGGLVILISVLFYLIEVRDPERTISHMLGIYAAVFHFINYTLIWYSAAKGYIVKVRQDRI